MRQLPPQPLRRRDDGHQLVLALPKGRFLAHVAAALGRIGGVLQPLPASRRASFALTIRGRPVTVKLMNVQDVAVLLRGGLIDFGVCSDEWMSEFRVGLPSRIDLGWCHTRIVFATPEDREVPSHVLRVATPYPSLTQKFLEGLGRPYRVLTVFGCPEALVPEVADGVVDCVETGRSLRENGLVERTVLLQSAVRLYSQADQEGSDVLAELENILP